MSIKIYTAYRIKNNKDYWPLTKDIHNTALLKLRRKIAIKYLQLMDSVDINSEEYKIFLNAGMSPERARASVIAKDMNDRYKAASVSPYRDFFNFDASVTFREYKKSIFVIPHCDISGIFDFLAKDNRLEDYHYQNQVDSPKNVNKQEWSKREKVWKALIEPDVWALYTMLEVCSYNKWWIVDPYFDLAQAKVFDKYPYKPESISGYVTSAIKK